MQQMTKEAITKLQSQTNHVLTVADFELIARLDECAARVVGMVDGDERSIFFPVEVGGACLYPLTIAKSELAATQDLTEREFVYLLSQPNDKPSLPTPQKLRREANRLYSGLTCTEKELSDAVVLTYKLSTGEDAPISGENAGSPNWPQWIDLLCSQYGSTPEMWVYEESLELIKQLIDRIAERNSAQAQATSKGVAPPPSARLKLLHEFRTIYNETKALWSE